jgi:hypothetical protein
VNAFESSFALEDLVLGAQSQSGQATEPPRCANLQRRGGSRRLQAAFHPLPGRIDGKSGEFEPTVRKGEIE